MGIEVDWRDMKGLYPQSSAIITLTGALTTLVHDLCKEQRIFLFQRAKDLFPSRQLITKRIYYKLQSFHYSTLQLSVICSSVEGKENLAQDEWDAIVQRIHMAGEPAAPLHLKIKAYHADVSRKDVERLGMKLDDIRSMVVPRQWYLESINADGTRPFEEVRLPARNPAESRGHFWLQLGMRKGQSTNLGQ